MNVAATAVLIAFAVGFVVFLLEAFVFRVAAPALGAVVIGVMAAGVYLIQSNPRTRL